MDNWFATRRWMQPFVVGLMRNGLLEKNYQMSLVTDTNITDTSNVGRRIFAEGSTKWRSVRSSGVVLLLCELLAKPDIKLWFHGEGRLDGAIAPKALMFLLGVDENTKTPGGGLYSGFYGPVSSACKRRFDLLGCKLAAFTKATLDDLSDWFTLTDDGKGVICNCLGRPQLDLKCINFDEADDWCIVKGYSYTAAVLASEAAGINSRLQPALEAQLKARLLQLPMHNTAFDCVPADMPAEQTSSSLSVGRVFQHSGGAASSSDVLAVLQRGVALPQ